MLKISRAVTLGLGPGGENTAKDTSMSNVVMTVEANV